MRVITWNRSFKGIPGAPNSNGKDELDSEEYETHATVLDKLLAWEKKLYDEVKVSSAFSSSFLIVVPSRHFAILFVLCSKES